ncbi:cytochrome P450 71A6-like [Rhododendron vialii]|uniref:cytochrome P450 71A6-like n=1 Tax=Rhododendron vialii TaxID=182163 RepID=UPI00265FDBDB|nr:cytochrome P450 71A6-like [Rhododendron vialii]
MAPSGVEEEEKGAGGGLRRFWGSLWSYWGVFDIGDFVPWLKWVNRVNGVRLAKELDEFLEGVDVFIAGTDTTSTTQEWAMTELLKYPQAMKKLQAEVRRIAQPNQPIIEDDLDQMPYLKTVIKETLRLHPSAPLISPRESTKDVQVMGYDIMAGTRVLVNAWFTEAIDELADANLVHKFDFALPDGVELDVSEGGGMIVHKKFPLLLVATPWSC